MPTINSLRPQTKLHHGKVCTVLRSVTVEDGEAFDVALAKSIVTLDGEKGEVTVANIELQF
jgi:hypothetical protein